MDKYGMITYTYTSNVRLDIHINYLNLVLTAPLCVHTTL